MRKILSAVLVSNLLFSVTAFAAPPRPPAPFHAGAGRMREPGPMIRESGPGRLAGDARRRASRRGFGVYPVFPAFPADGFEAGDAPPHAAEPDDALDLLAAVPVPPIVIPSPAPAAFVPPYYAFARPRIIEIHSNWRPVRHGAPPVVVYAGVRTE